MASETTNNSTNDSKPMLEDKLDGNDDDGNFSTNGKFEAITAATSNSNDNDNNDAAMDDDANDDEEETATDGGGHSSLAARPIVCILEEPMRPATTILSSLSSAATKKRQRCRMFRVIRSKGKALASGGFGVTVVTDLSGNEQEQEEDDDNDDDDEEESGSEHKDTTGITTVAVAAIAKEETNKDYDGNDATKETKSKSTPTVTTSTTRSAEYLFIEEVLFLHEKGLLRALMPSSSSSSTSTAMAKEEAGDGDDRVVGTATHTNSANDNDSNKNEIADDASTADATADAAKPLDTSQLYQLLPSMGISLAVYRVYSHLRSQDFRVLRHDPDRYDILCKQQKDQEERKQRLVERQQLERQQMQQQKQQKEDEHGNNGEDEDEEDPPLPRKIPRKQSLRLRRKIRESIQKAPPPTIPFPGAADNDNGDDASDKKKTLSICWDAYNPNSHFGKTHPGLPDFYVTATYYNVPTVRFSDLKDLLRDNKCQGIPLKVATVSDSGTVVMFGVTDYGIPPLEKKK